MVSILTAFSRFTVFLCAFTRPLLCQQLKNVDVTGDQLIGEDKAAFDIIRSLHQMMDDDLSGSIDPKESTEFVKEELHIEEKDRVQRRNEAFHHNNDEFVTVDEMWSRWFSSPEHNWTVDQIVSWLVHSVELPQYKEVFLRNEVNGSLLPRIAAPNSNYITSVLGVNNPVHRQKLHLKALDLVLFGYRGSPTDYTKDVVLITLLILALAGYWFAIYQRKTSQKKLTQLTTHLERLKDMESEFMGLQKKFEQAHTKQTAESPEDYEDMNILREQLIEAEKELEKRLPRLQTLLRKTYDLEALHLNQEKRDNLKEMEEAREMVEKMRKRQSGLLNQIRSVHGSETESMDRRIYSLKQRMERTIREMEEHKQRWTQIEAICGFPLTEEGRMKGAAAASAVVSNELPLPNLAVPFVAAHLPALTASASFSCGVGSKPPAAWSGKTSLLRHPPRSASTYITNEQDLVSAASDAGYIPDHETSLNRPEDSKERPRPTFYTSNGYYGEFNEKEEVSAWPLSKAEGMPFDKPLREVSASIKGTSPPMVRRPVQKAATSRSVTSSNSGSLTDELDGETKEKKRNRLFQRLKIRVKRE